MFRGRPPPRGYPPPFEGRGPALRPHPAPGYRDGQNRHRPPYHPDHRDHGHLDVYRHSPSHRRYPSPGAVSHRSGEYRGGPPAERSPSHRGPAPQDHNLLMTVGKELTGPAGPTPPRHHERDYSTRLECEQGRSTVHSQPRSRGRSKSCSPDRSRAKSRGRSKSRPRGQSRSPDRSRAKSRGRSKSRSPDRSRAKSRGRSKSRTRAQSRSPDHSRAKSQGRSKSRPRSRSRSRSRSRGRSHGRGRGRSKSRSSSSSSSSSSSYSRDKHTFKELEHARRKKELEELLTQPTKSILKKRNTYDDSPSVMSSDSPRDLQGGTMSRVAEQLLQAVRSTDPHTMASMLSELQSDPHMAQRPGLDAEIKEILNLLGGSQQKAVDDIDDEEKFLYGDSEEPKPQTEPVRYHGLELYGDVTEDSLYMDPPTQRAAVGQMYSGSQPGMPHVQAPPTISEVDLYMTQPSSSSDQNITIQVSNPSWPPGTEPLEEGERQALEEYEKIQDLLKTIGLDLGVADIGKMAARTKERLQGNKPPPKTPTRQRRYSSDSSEGSRHSRGRRRRSHSSSSSRSDRSRSRGKSHTRGDWSSEDDDSKNTTPPKFSKDRDTKEVTSEWSDAPPPQAIDPAVIPSHPGMPIPTYPPPPVHSMMPPNFPPPGYGQYGNYMSYLHQQWPSMYPPPSVAPPPNVAPPPSVAPPPNVVPLPNVAPPLRMVPPPQTSVGDFPLSGPYKPAPAARAKGVARSTSQDEEQQRSHDRRVSDEQNNESQKQKVLEEREKLKEERELRMKKKEYLIKELERLRKQQGELLRKKRREKDGHKDPLLQEISRLQEEVMTQVSHLRKEHEAAEKKRSEIEKVALILGLTPSDRPSRPVKQADVKEDKPPPQKKKRESEKNSEEHAASCSSLVKPTMVAPTPAAPDKQPVTAQAPSPAPPPDPFEYYDAGNHWCKNCNVTSGSMFDFFTHLHSKSHRKTLDTYNRPWASAPAKVSKSSLAEEKQTKPAKGSEFLVPVHGFFCLLCKEFYGDAICAEDHVITHSHNEKYKKQMYENPLYEQRRNLDRQAGLALEASGKKRKHEEGSGSKEKEEKTKHKKEKRDKEKKKEEDAALLKDEKCKVKNEEEEEEKPKLGKKEQDFKKCQEPEKSYIKKDEDEKYKYIKKDDKYRYNRGEEEKISRYRNRFRDEHQYNYYRDESNRYEERAKYGSKDDDKYKHEKYSEVRSKFNRDQDEGKSKTVRGIDKPTGEPEVSKSGPPPKPYELPKIFCGPSPAMRAKLRKQSLESGKSPATSASFGKFTWKKKENQLAKEAQKVAAEFIKEDEIAANEQSSTTEDSFAKSMAFAKDIAEKLASEKPMTPPWFTADRGRIRPNLPPPTTQMRKAAMAGKPASLSTFLNIRPQSTSIPGPPSGPLIRPPNVHTPLPQTNPGISFPTPGIFDPKSAPALTKSEPFGPKLPPSMSKPETQAVNSAQARSKPNPTELEIASSKAKEEPTGSKPGAVQSKPPLFQVSCAPPVSEASTVKSKLTPETKSGPAEQRCASSKVDPAPPVQPKNVPVQPAVIKIVSDVAAPGVPESEQTCTVFVKPPPFMSKIEGTHKSEKVKSNLAAAKAQDLFGIFYSSGCQQGPSSFCRSETDDKSIFAVPHAPQPLSKTKPQSPFQTQPQPQDKPQSSNPTQPQPQDKPQSSFQTQPQPQDKPQSSIPTQPQPQDKPQSSNPTQPQPQDKPQSSFQTKPQPQNKPQSQIEDPPLDKTQSQLNPPAEPHNQPLSLTHIQLPAKVQISPQPDSNNRTPSPERQSESDLKITSVWSIQSSITEGVPMTQLQSTLPHYDQPSNTWSESQTNSQFKSSEVEHTAKPQTETDSCFKAESQSDFQLHQDTLSQLEMAAEPQPKAKQSPKTRGKSTQVKKTPPASAPSRQTRSQTRYQTRQQQHQSQPEPDLAEQSHDSTVSDTQNLEPADPGSQAQLKAETTDKGGPSVGETTPEIFELPMDMTSMDFDYNFE